MRKSYRSKNTITSLRGKADPLGFFEGLALAKLENKELVFSYEVQRKFFGAVPFGKKNVFFDSSKGTLTVHWSSGFGGDYECHTLRYDQVNRCFAFASSMDSANLYYPISLPKR